MPMPWEEYGGQSTAPAPWEEYGGKLTRDQIAAQIQNDPISQGARSFPSQGSDALGGVSQSVLNGMAGFVRGAGSIGATLARPFESKAENDQRRAGIDANLQSVGAQPDTYLYKGGKLGGEIAGTAGVGGVLAKPLQALAATRYASGLEPVIEGVARGLQTGGFRVGELAGTGLGTAVRAGTGAAVGYGAAGMVNPEDANTGAVIGGALPMATQLAGKAGSAIRRAFAPEVSPEVRQLAQRAEELGINIPADRLTNSRPLNAVASSLNYVPMSGRAATEDAMNSQLNRALSKTFGQDSSNVTMALRKAETVLGGQFDDVLKNNTVKVDDELLQQLLEHEQRAKLELPFSTGHHAPPASGNIIKNQIDQILTKGANGEIDGQAAYNIKKSLDRIGNGTSEAAYYARDLKKSLMEALNRSLGPEQAAAFAQTRQQYGAMLDLQKLARNGADGEISVARLANMRNINNPQMQELADIAAQFVKPREGAHGAAQRVGLGFGAGMLGNAIGGPIGAGVTTGTMMAGGRALNSVLNSNAARNYVLGSGTALLGQPEPLGLLTQGAYRSLPLVPGLLSQ